MDAYNRLIAFVDWNSQLRLVDPKKTLEPKGRALKAIKSVGRNAARALAQTYVEKRFVVDLRLYYGWHKGFEPTPAKKIMMQVVAETDFSALSQKENVVFSGEVSYGDRLIFALDKRLHNRLGIHLPNTLRVQDKRRDEQEKMVDTALAADLVSSAAQKEENWLLVIAEDDDAIPAIYCAEALISGDRRVLLLRKRIQSGPYLNLDGIITGVGQ